MVTRAEGYRAAAGKEGQAIGVLREFLLDKLGEAGDPVEGADDNYLHGDLRFAPGVTVECKGQPVDAARYARNFVEVFEVTSNDRHLGGFSRLASILGMSEPELAAVPVSRQGQVAPLGVPSRVSVSVVSTGYAAFTAYVNAARGLVYVYSREELAGHLRSAVRRGLVRGAGRSNEDTHGVFVPHPAMRWDRAADGSWAATGSVPDGVAVGALGAVLLSSWR